MEEQPNGGLFNRRACKVFIMTVNRWHKLLLGTCCWHAMPCTATSDELFGSTVATGVGLGGGSGNPIGKKVNDYSTPQFRSPF